MRGITLVCAAAALVAAGSLCAPSARAQHVHERAYVATLNGAAVFPPTGSPAIGFAQVQIDLVLFTMRVKVTLQGLSGTVTEAHIHGLTEEPLIGTAGGVTQVPTLPSFPTGVTSVAYDQTFSLALESSYDPNFIFANGGTVSLASQALFAGMDAGQTYLDVHTTAFVGGEVRGFLLPVPPADFDFDGVVGASDLPIWRDSFAVEHHGDATGDGFTLGDDFLTWQQQLGAVAKPGGGHGGHGGGHATSTPEPDSLLLAMSTALLARLVASRRRR
jgi:hypothetical protein